VSRARCGILHAAPQSRDRTKHRRSLRPRLCSAPLRKCCALRCVRGTKEETICPTLPTPIIAGTRIGHVHLKVADLDRALGFYCGVLGFEVMQRYGDQAAFISAGGYHHHIGLNTWESKGGHPPAPGTTGLFHTAILYPTRAALADALHRVLEAGIQLDGASDHGVSEALYLRDPDQNGVELYRDRAQSEWPRNPDGSLAMFTRKLDLDDLMRQREG
jgi:catechol 2,3-dioxygenase